MIQPPELSRIGIELSGLTTGFSVEAIDGYRRADSHLKGHGRKDIPVRHSDKWGQRYNRCRPFQRGKQPPPEQKSKIVCARPWRHTPDRPAELHSRYGPSVQTHFHNDCKRIHKSAWQILLIKPMIMP